MPVQGDGVTVTIRAHLDGVVTPEVLRAVLGAAESLRELVGEALPIARTELTVSPPLPTAPLPATAAPAPAPEAAGLFIDLAGHIVTVDGVEIPLTHKEFGLLAYLATSPRRVYSRGQLLAAVWNIPHSHGIGERTVDVHVRRLRRKLGDAGAHIVTVRGTGYRFDSTTGRYAVAEAVA
ncbi:hypothetical protein GCM10009547_44090 [Sporichthya brevicatena]|uniref:OmpR/PhoB-type domain-containing protein n=2 Tax=Sporichthya brevicatena TaxID=171442 RepID=A0ABN1HA46_9ACTN